MATAVTLAQAREVIPTILMDDDLQRVVDVAINEVDRYAPSAPEPNRVEAVLSMLRHGKLRVHAGGIGASRTVA